MINSVKSCNSFSVGQLLMLRQLEERTGVPGGFIESDLVDPRYFSAANIKNRDRELSADAGTKTCRWGAA